MGHLKYAEERLRHWHGACIELVNSRTPKTVSRKVNGDTKLLTRNFLRQGRDLSYFSIDTTATPRYPQIPFDLQINPTSKLQLPAYITKVAQR
jgi:hypothetical protein